MGRWEMGRWGVRLATGVSPFIQDPDRTQTTLALHQDKEEH
ncbi:hypothetical protein [Moorena sp. SIOASIH]|nr:hypothetical protein [Moorena sp. SIOASIH]